MKELTERALRADLKKAQACLAWVEKNPIPAAGDLCSRFGGCLRGPRKRNSCYKRTDDRYEHITEACPVVLRDGPCGDSPTTHWGHVDLEWRHYRLALQALVQFLQELLPATSGRKKKTT